MYKHLVIGNGEIGQAIAEIFEADTYDTKTGGMEDGQYDIIHICFPYSEDFIEQVKKYKQIYKPEIVIIHSTIGIGVAKDLDAVHSPVRGVHPNLVEGIKTFVKYIGTDNVEIGNKVLEIFKEHGITGKIVSSRNSEAGKLLSTTYYGWNILFEKYVHQFCIDNDLDFDIVYKDFNETYNEGYRKLDMDYVVRPVLKHFDGEIGGHCIIPNCKLLDIEAAKLILHKNKNI